MVARQLCEAIVGSEHRLPSSHQVRVGRERQRNRQPTILKHAKTEPFLQRNTFVAQNIPIGAKCAYNALQVGFRVCSMAFRVEIMEHTHL